MKAVEIKSHVKTLVIHELGFDPNFYTFALISLIEIVLCGTFHSTKFTKKKCFHVKSELTKIYKCFHTKSIREKLARAAGTG